MRETERKNEREKDNLTKDMEGHNNRGKMNWIWESTDPGELPARIIWMMGWKGLRDLRIQVLTLPLEMLQVVRIFTVFENFPFRHHRGRVYKKFCDMRMLVWTLDNKI